MEIDLLQSNFNEQYYQESFFQQGGDSLTEKVQSVYAKNSNTSLGWFDVHFPTSEEIAEEVRKEQETDFEKIEKKVLENFIEQEKQRELEQAQKIEDEKERALEEKRIWNRAELDKRNVRNGSLRMG